MASSNHSINEQRLALRAYGGVHASALLFDMVRDGHIRNDLAWLFLCLDFLSLDKEADIEDLAKIAGKSVRKTRTMLKELKEMDFIPPASQFNA